MIKHYMNFKCKSFEWGIHVNCELFKSIMQTRQSASQSIRQPTYISLTLITIQNLSHLFRFELLREL